MAWLIFVGALVAAIWIGLRFRAGRHRNYLRWYRSSTLPAAARNSPIVAPILAGLLLPAVLIATPIFVDIETDIVIDARYLAAIAYLGGAYLLISLASVEFLLYRLPKRLVPRWLRDEDDRIGFKAVAPDWFDKVLLGFAILCLGLGVVLGAAGLNLLL